jgi:hypothetical protein
MAASTAQMGIVQVWQPGWLRNEDPAGANKCQMPRWVVLRKAWWLSFFILFRKKLSQAPKK